MKIKIRCEKHHLQHLIACGAMLMKQKQNLLAQFPQTQMIIDFQNLKSLMLLLIQKHASPVKRPLVSFDANYFPSVKRIIECSRVKFDEYYKVLLTECFVECNEQVQRSLMEENF